MTGELISTGVTFGVGRNSLNDAFSGTAEFNNIVLDSGADFSGGTGGGVIYSGGTDLYNIFGTGGGTTASNGLTKSGNNITLGGPLTGATIVQTDGVALYFTGDASTIIATIVDAGAVSNVSVTNGTDSYMASEDATKTFWVGANQASGARLEYSTVSGGTETIFKVNGTSIRAQSGLAGFPGITYDIDYSANYTNRSIVDYQYVNNHVASATTSSGGVEPFTTLPTTGGTIVWNVSGDSTNYEVTLTANTTLNLTNVRDGEYGTFVITQDSVGGRTITLGTVNGGGTHKVSGGGGGAIVLTSTANAIDILTFTYNGSTMYWVVGNDYT